MLRPTAAFITDSPNVVSVVAALLVAAVSVSPNVDKVVVAAVRDSPNVFMVDSPTNVDRVVVAAFKEDAHCALRLPFNSCWCRGGELAADELTAGSELAVEMSDEEDDVEEVMQDWGAFGLTSVYRMVDSNPFGGVLRK